MNKNVFAMLTLIFILLLSVATFASSEQQTYTDDRGNKIEFIQGEKSFATKVVEFTPGSPWTRMKQSMDPNKILGSPDYNSSDDTGSITLGSEGVIVIEFGDVEFSDGPGDDIYVFEVGPDVEATKVEVSKDLVEWIYVGDAKGSLCSVDMAGKVDADATFKYIRITDLVPVSSGTWPGADIDAVGVINASIILSQEPTPTATLTPAPTAAPAPSTGSEISGFKGESISSGAKLWWNPVRGGVGYRVFRSTNRSDEGISATDFYITSNEFVDVNVDANKTYYYTVRQVLKEARPFEGLKEELGPVTAKVTVKTGSTILGGNASDSPAPKQFILMTLDDPYMSVNGVREEIDPGRGTTPLILNSRTMVPIRAIVEAMDGRVAWNDSTRKITLNYKNQAVVMTLNEKSITVNGSSKTIDVAPTVINSRTMVPIRFAAENLGCEVDWINSTRQIVIVFR